MEHNSGGLNKKTYVLYEIDFMLNNSCFLAEIYVQWNVSIKYNNLNWVKVTKSNTTSRTNILNYNICGYIYVYSAVILIAM